jgi:hypothetical protein
MPRDCLQLLTDPDGYAARCTQPWGTEHSHHDHTARETARADLAECLPGCHDWDGAGPGTVVCAICHLVKES